MKKKKNERATPAPYKSMTDEEKIQEYKRGETNAWKYASLERRLEVGL